jgi:flagellar secretion chaperone FliS
MMEASMNYAAEAATGVTPLGLIVRLYETLISDLGRAITAVRDGDIERRTFELQHALAIIGHLQGALDMNHGGDPAVLLDRFYTLARTRIFDSQLHQSAKSLEELMQDLILLRDVWIEVEKAQPAAAPPPPKPGNPGQWVA